MLSKIKSNRTLIIMFLLFLCSINFINNTVNTFEYLFIVISCNLIYKIKRIIDCKKYGFKYKLKSRITVSIIFSTIIIFYSINQTRFDYLSIFIFLLIFEYYVNIGIPLSDYKMQLSWVDKITITLLIYIALHLLLMNISLSIIITILIFIFIVGSTTDREKV